MTEEVHNCVRCKKNIIQGHAYELGGDRWHTECFSCYKCQKSLDCQSDFLVLGTGDLICFECSDSCKKCGKKIDDLAIILSKDEEAYCQGCFTCTNCGKNMDDLRYAKTRRGLFCIACHEKLLQKKKNHELKKKRLSKVLPTVPGSARPDSPVEVDSASLAVNANADGEGPHETVQAPPMHQQRSRELIRQLSTVQRSKPPSPLKASREELDLQSSIHTKASTSPRRAYIADDPKNTGFQTPPLSTPSLGLSPERQSQMSHPQTHENVKPDVETVDRSATPNVTLDDDAILGSVKQRHGESTTPHQRSSIDEDTAPEISVVSANEASKGRVSPVNFSRRMTKSASHNVALDALSASDSSQPNMPAPVASQRRLSPSLALNNNHSPAAGLPTVAMSSSIASFEGFIRPTTPPRSSKRTPPPRSTPPPQPSIAVTENSPVLLPSKPKSPLRKAPSPGARSPLRLSLDPAAHVTKSDIVNSMLSSKAVPQEISHKPTHSFDSKAGPKSPLNRRGFILDDHGGEITNGYADGADLSPGRHRKPSIEGWGAQVVAGMGLTQDASLEKSAGVFNMASTGNHSSHNSASGTLDSESHTHASGLKSAAPVTPRKVSGHGKSASNASESLSGWGMTSPKVAVFSTPPVDEFKFAGDKSHSARGSFSHSRHASQSDALELRKLRMEVTQLEQTKMNLTSEIKSLSKIRDSLHSEISSMQKVKSSNESLGSDSDEQNQSFTSTVNSVGRKSFAANRASALFSQAPLLSHAPAEKKTKFWRLFNKTEQRKVFGVPLEQQCISENLEVPFIVTRCLQEIENHLYSEGLYRKSGSILTIESLEKEFEKTLTDTESLQQALAVDINAVTSLLKRYLRKLPNPIITFDLYDAFINASREEKRLVRFQGLVRLLPPAHATVLRMMAEHMNHVAQYSNENLMNMKNLSVVLAPCLIHDATGERDIVDTAERNKVIDYIFTHYEEIF